MDTDSIIYVDRPNDTYHPTIGNFLGTLYTSKKRRLSVVIAHAILQVKWLTNLKRTTVQGATSQNSSVVAPNITRIRCGVPTINKKRSASRWRGSASITPLQAAINFENLRQKVFAYVQARDRQETVIRIQRIERTAERTIVTVVRKKVYWVTYDKRVITPDFSTVPYGFRD